MGGLPTGIAKETNRMKHKLILHSLYLSMIIMNIGIALAFGILPTFVMALLTMIHWMATSLKEEEVLLQKFPDADRQYKKKAPWRLLPGGF
jgi:protein-S-isoprenylcysteine O-methyltransferase Ste14